MKSACLGLALLAAFLFFIGFWGRAHPTFDSIAIGRPLAFAACAVFASLYFVVSRRVGVGLALALVGFGAAAAMGWKGGEQAGELRVYSKNLLYENPTPELVAEDVRATRPDIAVFQEAAWWNRATVLAGVHSILPHRAICPWEGWNSIAVASRWPVAKDTLRCSPERSLLAVRVERPGAPFWMVGVHLQHPWPDIQWQLLEQALPVLEGLDAPVVMVGDFNTVPWSAAAETLGQRTGTRVIGPRKSTFWLWGLGLPLDQVWGLHGQVETRPALGSDHLGLLAEVTPAAPDR